MEGGKMLRGMIVAVMLVALSSSARAQIILRDYKGPKNENEKALNEMYLEGVIHGVQLLNAAVRQDGQKPEFCMPPKLALTIEQAEDIMMRAAKTVAEPDCFPIAVLLIEGLKETFPCDEKH
jgi:hypothetical protein